MLGATPQGLGGVSATLPFSVGGASAPSSILSVDRAKLIAAYYPGLDPFTASQFYDDPTQDALASYNVVEQTYAGYLQGNFKLGALSLNAGLRVVETDTHSKGTSLIGTTATPSDVGSSYWNFLPAINARWEVMPNALLRATYSRAMTRPTLDQLSPATIINSGPRTGTRGNPNLRPYLADQGDLGFEWYFHNGALLTLTGFAKQINSLISQTTSARIPPRGSNCCPAVGWLSVHLPGSADAPVSPKIGKLPSHLQPLGRSSHPSE